MTAATITVADARSKLEEHFGSSKLPSKYENLLEWWTRVLSDPSVPPRMRMACERDLDEILGPIVGREAVWVMTVADDRTSSAG